MILKRSFLEAAIDHDSWFFSTEHEVTHRIGKLRPVRSHKPHFCMLFLWILLINLTNCCDWASIHKMDQLKRKSWEVTCFDTNWVHLYKLLNVLLCNWEQNNTHPVVGFLMLLFNPLWMKCTGWSFQAHMWVRQTFIHFLPTSVSLQVSALTATSSVTACN